MKRKRTMALLMAFALTAATFAGCGNGDEKADDSGAAQTDTEIAFPLKEPVTMSMFAVSATTTGTELPDNAAFQKMAELTNVSWEVTSCSATDLQEQRGVVLNTGDYQDVLYKSGIGSDDIAKYGMEGILLPLEDLIQENMPNLKAVLDERDAWNEITSADGHIYSLPFIDQPGLQNILMWINVRWLDKVGMEEPNSWETLYEVLKAFKEKDPNGNGEADEIPYVANTALLPFYLFGYDLPVDMNSFCAVNDEDEIVYSMANDDWYDYLYWMHKFYEEGLMNDDAFQATPDKQYATGPDDVYGLFLGWSPSETVGADLAEGYDYKVMDPWGDNSLSTTSGITEGGLCITDACEDPALVCAWADYFYSEEGGILMQLGIEGESFRWRDDGLWEWILDGDAGSEEMEVRDAYILQGYAHCPGLVPDFYAEKKFREGNSVSGGLEGTRVAQLAAKPFPRIQLTEAEQAEAGTITADLFNYAWQYQAEVITGLKDLDSTWEGYLAKMEEMGAGKYAEMYNSKYQEMKK